MPAPVSEPLRSTTSRRARAPRAWPRARDAIPRPSWVGCTPITPRVLTRSGFAAPAADPPLRSDCGGASRRRLRRPAYGRHPTPRGGRPGTTVDPQAADSVCAGALRPPLLPRDDPRGPAPPQAVVEESQEAARPGEPRAAAGLCRASPGRARRRPARPAPLGLPGRGAPPPGRGSRLWLGPARRALLGCLKLAGPIRAGLVLRAVPLQRGPGSAVALPARQWRTHDRGAAAPARRGARAPIDRAVGWGAVSPGQSRPGGRDGREYHADAAAELQPGSDAGRGALALAARGRHVPSLPYQRRGPDPAGGGLRGAPEPRPLRHRRPPLGQGPARPRRGETAVLKLDVVYLHQVVARGRTLDRFLDLPQ